MAAFPDFVTQMGRSAHIIDIRMEADLAKTGTIPGSNWYPRDKDGYLDAIQRDFPSGSLLAIVDYNGVISRQIAGILRDRYNFHFAAVLAGGVRLFKTFGFSVNRSINDIKKHCCEPLSLQKLNQFKNIDEEPLHKQERGLYHSERKTLEQVAKHVEGDLIQWIKIAAFSVHGRVSCIDGRGGNGCVGTPGGDMGEMVLILSTYEHLTGCDLTPAQIEYLFQHRLDTFGRFYLHTDETNASRALDYIGTNILGKDISDAIEHQLHLNQILPENYLREYIHLTPAEYHEDILQYLITPDCIGCGHLKLMLTRGEQYKVRPTLIKGLLRTFYESCFWDETSDCDFVVLSGSHEECGVLSIEMQNEIRPYTKVPLIAPSIPVRDGLKQMFVSHPTIMTFLRKQQCDWLLEAIENANFNAVQELQNNYTSFVPLSKNAKKAFNPLVDLSADQHAAISLGFLAAELPIYRLLFDAEHSRCRVDFIGFVEGHSKPATSSTSAPTAPTATIASTTATTTIPQKDNRSTIEPTGVVITSTSPSLPPLPPVNDGLNNDETAKTLLLSPSSNVPNQAPTTNAGSPLQTNKLSVNVTADTPSNLDYAPTPQHQFGKQYAQTDPHCSADHHGMVIRSPFPLQPTTGSGLPLASPISTQRKSFLGPLGSSPEPLSAKNSELSQFSLTAELILPSEVHHYIGEDDEDNIDTIKE
jgi:hypothetical protein